MKIPQLDTVEPDKFREECGLIGIWDHKEASNLAYLSLYAQQHRGQEGAGVVSIGPVEGNSRRGQECHFSIHRGLGLVSDVFEAFDFNELPGTAAIGHVRYSTAGSNTVQNVQPFVAVAPTGTLALAHNGNLINAHSLRSGLQDGGAIFHSSSDTEVLLHLIARAGKSCSRVEAVIQALQQVRGAFSLLLLFDDRLIAARDPNGFRPLVMGTLEGSVVFASETCAFDLVGATFIRDIEPGEVIEIFGAGGFETRSYFPFGFTRESPCIFEFVYFARPDSNVFGRNVYVVRKRLGEELAKESPVDADLVVPVPDSGVPAAMGFAQQSGIPFELGLIRNHYVGRTFIEPKQTIRDFGVKVKLNPNAAVLRGKRIIVIDDSIVRGTTSKKIVDMLKCAGAAVVHLRISAPPTTNPCYYGIDTPSKEELVAATKSLSEIAEMIGVDSLAYLSMEGMYRAVEGGKGKFCDACFSGSYPVGTPEAYTTRQASLFPIVG